MFYHYYEIDYAENDPKDLLLEYETDEEVLTYLKNHMASCKFCGYELDQITKPEIVKSGHILSVDYETIRIVKETAVQC